MLSKISDGIHYELLKEQTEAFGNYAGNGIFKLTNFSRTAKIIKEEDITAQADDLLSLLSAQQCLV